MATAMKRSIQEEQRDRRDRYICAALTGALAGGDYTESVTEFAKYVVLLADAAIAEADRGKP